MFRPNPSTPPPPGYGYASYRLFILSRIDVCLALKPIWGDLNHVTMKLNNRILSQTSTVFDLSRFIHSDCGSPTVKTYASKRTLLEEKYCRTLRSNQEPFDQRHYALSIEICRLMRCTGFN